MFIWELFLLLCKPELHFSLSMNHTIGIFHFANYSEGLKDILLVVAISYDIYRLLLEIELFFQHPSNLLIEFFHVWRYRISKIIFGISKVYHSRVANQVIHIVLFQNTKEFKAHCIYGSSLRAIKAFIQWFCMQIWVQH